MSKCAYCEYNDGAVYTSIPVKYKCTITGEFHLALDDCNVEFAPVKHGRWLDFQPAPWGQVYETCSVCGVRQANDKVMDNFCGVCGAKMDESTMGQVFSEGESK